MSSSSHHTTAFDPALIVALPNSAPDDTADHLGALLEDARVVNMEMRLPTGERTLKALGKSDLVVGIGAAAQWHIPPVLSFVSGQHFQLVWDQGEYSLIDLNSSNGTYLNGKKISPQTPYRLQDQDVIHIGDPDSEMAVRFIFRDPRRLAPAPGLRITQPQIALTGKTQVSIGRNPANDVHLDSPTVAWEQARLLISPQETRLISLEGEVLVNGHAQQEVILQPEDRIEITHHLLIFHGPSLTVYHNRGYRLDLIGGYKEIQTKQGPRRILDDINLSVLPHEFVALVGGSGAGKSTLMDGLNGFRQIAGQLIVNNRDFYHHYDEFRPLLGYVPQYDILPRSLTVETALHFVAKLRLPPHTNAEERQKRISDVLEIVNMNTEQLRRTRIGALSGGQRKRVSIASELLADPKLFFLDEPTSGLDPGLEKKMMLLLRRMADQGRTIILITHATSNIIEADQVAFLSGGRLVYFGPPTEAGQFFGVHDFADIYDRIQNNGEKWVRIFTQEQPALYQNYVIKRQAQLPTLVNTNPIQRSNFASQLKHYWHQFTVFAQRNLRLTLSDPVSLFVGLVVMPFVALIVISATQPNEMMGKPEVIADPVAAAQTMTESYLPALESHIVIFGMAILAVLVGAFAGSNDLLKERSIYLRERLVNLKIPPYLASKYAVFAGFAALQSFLYLFVLSLYIHFPTEGVMLPPFLEMWFSLFLTVMVGYAFGLLISAVSINNDMALYLVLIVVFFQYISAGAIYNIRGVEPAETISYITPGRWGTIAIGTTVNVQAVAQGTILCGDDKAGQPACQSDPQDESDLFLPYGTEADYLIQQWAYLVLMGVILTLITYGVLRMYDRLDLRLA